MITIAVDAMGGDNAPKAACEAAMQMVEEAEVRIRLVGPSEVLEGYTHPRILHTHATQVIEPEEPPVAAFRSKKDSTIAVGLSLVKHKKADAFVSAGSTGALLAGGLLTLGRIRGVDRPALTVVLPTVNNNRVLFLDVGANTDCKARNLYEFALMGSVYAEQVMGVKSPRVALLNIGSESNKGSEQTKIAHQMLAESGMNFVGNLEARDLFSEVSDVVVTDGFAGNVALKTVEGLAATMFSIIRQELSSDTKARLGALLVRPYLRRVASRLDYSEYGGAPLLGLAAPCIKCHGSSNTVAVLNGIRVAVAFAESEVTELVKNALRPKESA